MVIFHSYVKLPEGINGEVAIAMLVDLSFLPLRAGSIFAACGGSRCCGIKLLVSGGIGEDVLYAVNFIMYIYIYIYIYYIYYIYIILYIYIYIIYIYYIYIYSNNYIHNLLMFRWS